MKSIKINIKGDFEKIEIHAASDWHIGDEFCNEKLIHDRIEHIKNTDNAFLILNGDLMNNATKTSVSDSYAEKLTPMQQIDKLIEILKPVKNKILGITSGNHENRTYNKEGVDIMGMVARSLGIPERYDKTSIVIFLRFGRNKKTNKSASYTIYATHGNGGGRKEGAKAIRLADMASIVDFDCAIHSHTHLPMILKEAFFRTDIQNASVKKVDKLFVNTASCLEYGGYGEAYEYKPNSLDTPVIYLSGTERDLTAML